MQFSHIGIEKSRQLFNKIIESFSLPLLRLTFLSIIEQTLFWGPYYIPGTVLHADKINKAPAFIELILITVGVKD